MVNDVGHLQPGLGFQMLRLGFCILVLPRHFVWAGFATKL